MADKQILNTVHFWRLFHCLISHNASEEETARCKAVWSWMSDHYVTLKKIAGGLGGDGDAGEGLELLGIVWRLASVNNHLPGINLVRETAMQLDGRMDAVHLLLDEYKEMAPQLVVHPVADMDAILQDCCTEWERAAVHNMLQVANRITMGAMPDLKGKDKGKKKLNGPRDGIKYLLERIEQGVLVKPNQLLKPINVNREASTIGEWYDDYLNTKFLPTGIYDAQSRREILLEANSFVGILGYLHDGKSPVARHILYHIAQAGYNVLHISLENPGVKERNKFILQHAHNPKFGGKYQSLSYAKLRLKLLNEEERAMLDEVGADFEATIGGQIIIEQMGIASWEAIKTKIEEHNANTPLAAVCVDYLQLIDPPSDREADARTRMTAMVKDVRQFQMTFDGGRGLCLISPVQGNEAGHDHADESEGVWTASGVNNEKELARSMDFILGVFNRGKVGGLHDLVFSFPKDREGGEFLPFSANMTGCGWIAPLEAEQAAKSYVDPNTPKVMNSIYLTDTIGEEISVEVPDNG